MGLDAGQGGGEDAASSASAHDLSLLDAATRARAFAWLAGLVTVASLLCHLGDGAEPRAAPSRG